MKRWLARGLTGLILICGLVPVLAGESWACSCAGSSLSETQQWRAIAKTAPLIYVADVVGRTGGPVVNADGSQSLGEYQYQLRVVTNLKGGASGTRTATTNTQGSACGAVLQRDRRVLVYDERLSLCGGFTQERVQERAAIVRAALRSKGATHVVVRGEWLWQIARTELQGASSVRPSDAAVQRAVARLYAANRRVIGPNPNRLAVGTRLVVPQLR